MRSAQALGKTSSVGAIGSRQRRVSCDKLSRALQDRSVRVRMLSVLALGNIGSASATDGRLRADIVKQLVPGLGDLHVRVRVSTVTALEDVGFLASTPLVLREAIAEELSQACYDRDLRVRERAVQALGRIGMGITDGRSHESIVEQLTSALRSSVFGIHSGVGSRKRIVLAILGMGSADKASSHSRRS
mmetsp:Transcript_118001/g.341115  ORF Transcript_118001/g.341115 Transcript_118001/m.341115 type:complete len:189 (-) Transcript_118001:5-571(-)